MTMAVAWTVKGSPAPARKGLKTLLTFWPECTGTFSCNTTSLVASCHKSYRMKVISDTYVSIDSPIHSHLCLLTPSLPSVYSSPPSSSVTTAFSITNVRRCFISFTVFIIVDITARPSERTVYCAANLFYCCSLFLDDMVEAHGYGFSWQ